MRYPVKVGMIRSLIPCNPEGVRRVYIDRYDRKSCGYGERSWKAHRSHQWKVEDQPSFFFELPVISIRGPEWLRRRRAAHLCLTRQYRLLVPVQLFPIIGNHETEQVGTASNFLCLYDFTHCWGDDCKREEIYRHEVNMFKYEYRDSFIDEGEYFGTHGWDIGSLLDYERNNT